MKAAIFVAFCLLAICALGTSTIATIVPAQEDNDFKEKQPKKEHFYALAYMYAADHIRRVLKTFPGVFTGIGEFSIHKEFVSAKISGVVASLQDPALDRLIDFAAEVGLVILIHNDVDVPFAKPGAEPAYAREMKALLLRHPNATFIWAHIGVGRIIRPIKEQAAIIENVINDPKLSHGQQRSLVLERCFFRLVTNNWPASDDSYRVPAACLPWLALSTSQPRIFHHHKRPH